MAGQEKELEALRRKIAFLQMKLGIDDDEPAASPADTPPADTPPADTKETVKEVIVQVKEAAEICFGNIWQMLFQVCI